MQVPQALLVPLAPEDLSWYRGPTDTGSALNYFKLVSEPRVPNCRNCEWCGAGTYEQFCFHNWPDSATDTFDIRIDQHFNDKNSLFGVTLSTMSTRLTPDSFPEVDGLHPGTGPIRNFPGTAKERQQSLGLEFVHVFRPDLLVQLIEPASCAAISPR